MGVSTSSPAMQAEPRNRTRAQSRYVQTLMLALGAYLVVPVVEVPLIGLSLSAVLMLMLGERLLLNGNLYFGRLYRPYNWGFGLLIGGIVIATLISGLIVEIGDYAPRPSLVVRYIYLGIVAFVTMRVVVESNIEPRLVRWMGVAVKILTVLLGLAVFARIELMTPNMFAMQMTMFSPFILPGLIVPGKRMKTGAWVAAIWGLSLLNGSRQGIIILGMQLVVFIVIVALNSRNRLQVLLMLPAIGAFIAAGILVGLVVAPSDVQSYVLTKSTTTRDLEYDKSWQTRLVMNQRSRAVFLQHPVVGVGVGGLGYAEVSIDIPSVLSGKDEAEFAEMSAHNSHMQILAESGVVGFVPWLLLIMMLLVGGLRVLTREVRRERYFVLTALLAVIGMVIQLWVITGHSGTAPYFIFACLAGGVIRARSLQRKEALIHGGTIREAA